MHRAIAAALATAFALAGCATAPAVPPPPSAADAAAWRGQAFAVRRCSGCHAIGLDASPGASGPAFHALRMRYNEISLQKRFAEISAHGSGEMPPIEISPSEAADLIAYIESLGTE